MTSASFAGPADEILQTMERIYRYRMTTTSGGNLSIREANGDIWITPARVDKGTLTRADIVLARADGTVEGKHPPSSELPMHQAIYRARPDARGIVHAHPVALVAFSLVHEVPDTRLFHQAWHVCGKPGFAPYALPATEALGASVAAAFARGHDCVILENHGTVTIAEDLQTAFHRFETLEFTGKTIIKARLLSRDIHYLSEAEIELGTKSNGSPVARGNDPASSASSGAEKALRTQLRDFVRRAYQQRLFISTQGIFSARLNETSFLITPPQIDRERIAVEDLLLVESGKARAQEAKVHDAIYRQHPNIGAIVNAYPVNATAFSVTRRELQTRTIPESYIIVRDVGTAAYAMQFTDPAALANLISETQPVHILDNGGVLVTGRDILDAYDRLEVLESTAEAVINSRALGELKPMSDEIIREIEAAYFRPGSGYW